MGVRINFAPGRRAEAEFEIVGPSPGRPAIAMSSGMPCRNKGPSGRQRHGRWFTELNGRSMGGFLNHVTELRNRYRS
jgi:hypothetical protein